MIKSFRESANNFKKELEYTIAYNYAIYDDGQEKDLLTRMKNRVMITDRQFLDENLQKEADRVFVCPEKVLMDKVEEIINEFYDEFKLSKEIEKEFNEYGDYTLKSQKSVKEKLEASQKRTLFDIQKELSIQINRGSNARNTIIAIRKIIEKRVNYLERTLSDIALQLDTDMILCEYKSKGYKYFRTVTHGENCDACNSKAGKITLIEDAVTGETKPPFHPNCDCSIEVLDDDGNVVYTNAEIEKNEQGWEKYFQTSLKQLILGNYTDDVNLLGTVLQMLAGLVGVDLPMDIRDLFYDVTNFKLTKEHIAQTILDAVALLPVIGGIKYVDEAGNVLKYGSKYGDEVTGNLKVVNKATDFADFPKNIHVGRQGKHIIGHNNYKQGKSIFTKTIEEAQDLINKYSGTGKKVGQNREIVDFEKIIGKYVDPQTGKAYDTTIGTIHYSKDGTHIVPERPKNGGNK